jgi:hypothetical protein
MTAEGNIQEQEIIQHAQEYQERCVHCNFWVQLLASSKQFKNTSTLIIYFQRKKYVSFAKFLNGKIKNKELFY